jgi:hypothetical protein
MQAPLPSQVLSTCQVVPSHAPALQKVPAG